MCIFAKKELQRETWDVINADVDDHRAVFYPLAFHHLGVPGAHHQDVRLLHLHRGDGYC